MVDKNLAAALQLEEDCEDEEVTTTLIAFLTSAIHDNEPRQPLAELHRAIANTRAPEYLDPLNTLPLLLTCKNEAAEDIISVIAKRSSAKEVVMATQEALERLEHSLEKADDADEDSESEMQQESIKYHTILNQLNILINTYGSAIPRITLRRKSATETLRPLCEELATLIGFATAKATRSQALALLFHVSNLVKDVGEWAIAVGREKPDDVKACKMALKSLLDRSLFACEHFIQANIAQRTLEECYPRLALRSRTSSNWHEGAESMAKLVEACTSLGLSFAGGACSTSDLVISAYQSPIDIAPGKLLSFLLPVLITSFQTNTFLDESLAVLIRALHSQAKGDDLPHDITLPLSGLLPSIASAHPDPAIRHQAFRVLSLLLLSSNLQLRFQHLVELTRDSEFPQMRVASVGLVKESVLHALSSPRHEKNPFLGPLFLRTFGPILLRPDPPDLFASALTLKDFQETHEPARLVECLSLFYVLLLRDEQNLTGIRDKDVIKSIDNNLLAPLRRNLAQWMDDPSISKSLHDHTGVVPLQISLERINAALASYK